MKIMSKFSPRKEKHANKFPYIINFDYSEINFKLGIIFSDDTLSTVNFMNFENKTQSELETSEQTYKLP